MKVFISIKYHGDHADRARLENIRTLAGKHGMNPVCVAAETGQGGALQSDPYELMRQTFLELRDSKLVIVDLTEKGVGVGIEAGYAKARGIPIVTIAAAGSEISETLAGISDKVFIYKDWEALDQFMGELEKEFVPANQALLILQPKTSHC